ncbi:MAG: hypothetical protein IT462_06035 [Planctomycetes bacterium]|nr:hypothetical protein [Planctomycetota bacterium]
MKVQLSATQIRAILIGVAVTLGVMFLLGLLWDLLWKIAGILIAVCLITMGLRFLLGAGLPKMFKRAADNDEGKPTA